MSNDIQQKQFTGWAVVDVLGHQRYVGFVTTDYFGNVAMFRIDVPALEERSRTIGDSDGYVPQWGTLPIGAVVRESGIEPDVVIVGAGSIYQMRPCSHAVALQERENESTRKVLSVTAADGLPIERPSLEEMPW